MVVLTDVHLATGRDLHIDNTKAFAGCLVDVHLELRVNQRSKLGWQILGLSGLFDGILRSSTNVFWKE